MDISISDREFARYKSFIREAAGIHLSDSKKVLVASRLSGRLRARDMTSFEAYFRLISQDGETQERQTAVDLLTTNETYFFREAKHFDFLASVVGKLSESAEPFRVWSAAASTGEEAYSIAMLLSDKIPRRPWEIFGSDISTRALAKARTGLYPMERASKVPPHYLKKYCLKGNGKQEGMLLVDSEIRSRVRFEQINLMRPLPETGDFSVIFLRNVLIYFELETKAAVVRRLLDRLRPGGYFCVGHSESLHGVCDELEAIAPAIYRRPFNQQ